MPLNVVLSYYYLAALYVTIGLWIVNEPICKIFGDILPFEEKKQAFDINTDTDDISMQRQIKTSFTLKGIFVQSSAFFMEPFVRALTYHWSPIIRAGGAYGHSKSEVNTQKRLKAG